MLFFVRNLVSSADSNHRAFVGIAVYGCRLGSVTLLADLFDPIKHDVSGSVVVDYLLYDLAPCLLRHVYRAIHRLDRHGLHAVRRSLGILDCSVFVEVADGRVRVVGCMSSSQTRIHIKVDWLFKRKIASLIWGGASSDLRC